jgi:hypothetical protein
MTLYISTTVDTKDTGFGPYKNSSVSPVSSVVERFQHP